MCQRGSQGKRWNGLGPERRILRKHLQGPQRFLPVAPTPPENKRPSDQEMPPLARSQGLPPSPEAGQPCARLSVQVPAGVMRVAPGGDLALPLA